MDLLALAPAGVAVVLASVVFSRTTHALIGEPYVRAARLLSIKHEQSHLTPLIEQSPSSRLQAATPGRSRSPKRFGRQRDSLTVVR